MCSDQQIWIHFSAMATLWKFVRIHKFQDIYMHIYLRFKSCILVAFLRGRNVSFIDDIKILLCFMVICMPVLICHSKMGWILLK